MRVINYIKQARVCMSMNQVRKFCKAWPQFTPPVTLIPCATAQAMLEACIADDTRHEALARAAILVYENASRSAMSPQGKRRIGEAEYRLLKDALAPYLEAQAIARALPPDLTQVGRGNR